MIAGTDPVSANVPRVHTKLDAWVRALLVDPIGKGPLVECEGGFTSAYGRRYAMVGGIPDLRRIVAGDAGDAQVWRVGQLQYEAWSRRLVEQDCIQDYRGEIEGVREVYAEIPLVGRVLDVGGHQGRLREFLQAGQEYLSCDPYIEVFDSLHLQAQLLAAYRCLAQPCNFLAAHAEHLPLAESAFDTVHMRSVIDHLRDPALALLEAFRVLKPGGALVVGLYVEGGRSGRRTARESAKEIVRGLLPYVGVRRFEDHHVWHPTFAELGDLIGSCGFSIDKVHWQRAWKDRVCYVLARKPMA